MIRSRLIRGSSRGHPPRESLANWLRSSVGRYRHVGHTGGVCCFVRPSAAPSQVDGRSWERPFQRRDAKCVTLGTSEAASTSLLAFQRHSWRFIRLSRLRFAGDLLMMVHPRGTSATSGLEITAELIVIDLIAIGRCGTVSASSFFGTVSSFGCAWDFVCSSRVFLSTVLAQDPGREPHDWMIRIYHHTSQLRANSERAPLNSPSVSGHRLLRVSPGLLLSSFGAVLLLSSSCVVLCVLICPDPSLRCCASLLLRPRPSFSLCVEAAVVCVAGGRRHEIAARAALL